MVMVQIGVVRMGVSHRAVQMLVDMALISGEPKPVLMTVVFVVIMPVNMDDLIMLVVMHVSLRQVQPYSYPHQDRGGSKGDRDGLAQKDYR